MVMLFGILFCLLGIVSIYIGQIYEEVKGRPNFVVRQTLGFGRQGGRSEPLRKGLYDESDNDRQVAGRRDAPSLPEWDPSQSSRHASTADADPDDFFAGTPPEQR
jgi:hypothetical protein